MAALRESTNETAYPALSPVRGACPVSTDPPRAVPSFSNVGLCASQLGRGRDRGRADLELPADVFGRLIEAVVSGPNSFAEVVAQGRA